MPIAAPHEPSPPAARDANRRGVELHRQERFEEAVAAFRDGTIADPESAELHTNLGVALARLGRFDEARCAYDRVLQIDPDDLRAHLALYELEQAAGNGEKALAHQARALEQRTLFSEIAPRERRRILALMAPGDWQANVPVDFLVDHATSTVHKLFLTGGATNAVPLPSCDVVLTAIAESDANEPLLHAAEAIVERCGLPVINAPRRILGTSRTRVWESLRDIAGLVVPQTVRVSREALRAGAVEFGFPHVVRPVGSHAGHGLDRIENGEQLTAYLSGESSGEFYVMPYLDFSQQDGYFRKYRIIIVGGVPYAYHLAISPRWLIHYYNAPMRDHAWMRQEEERFLERFESVFTPEHRAALGEIASRLDLEYVGVDCSIDRKGRLVLFEADPAMIVHAGDDPAVFGYKLPAARRIFAAFERLVDRARSG